MSEQIEVPREYSAILDRFLARIESLASSLPTTLSWILAARSVAQAQYSKFVESDKVTKYVDNNREMMKIKYDSINEFNKISKKLRSMEAAMEIVPRSFMTSMVSQYDSYLGDTIAALMFTKPDIVNASERSISFGELVSFGSLDAARQHIIDKSVETVLRKSHTDHFKFLESIVGVKISPDPETWGRFIELTERRNLFAHADGRVSDQYIKNCKLNGVDIGDLNTGDILHCNQEYAQNTFLTLYELSFMLTQVIWRVSEPDQLEQANIHATRVTFQLLVEKEYDLARKLCQFLISTQKIKDSMTDSRYKIISVNLAQCHKWLGDDDSCREIMNGIDWTASSDEFKLASAVLSDDFESAYKYMMSTGVEGEIDKADYMQWPLFKEFRKSEQFGRAYKQLTGDDMDELVEEAMVAHPDPVSAADRVIDMLKTIRDDLASGPAASADEGSGQV